MWPRSLLEALFQYLTKKVKLSRTDLILEKLLYLYSKTADWRSLYEASRPTVQNFMALKTPV